MLDIKYIRENKEKVIQNTRNRGVDADVEELLRIDENRRSLISEIDDLRAKRNTGSKGKPSPEEIAEMKKTRQRICELEEKSKNIEIRFKELLHKIPNMSHPEVRISDDEDDNPVLEEVGHPTEFDFKPLDHVQLTEKHDLIDFERGARVAGAKFYYLKNEAALLEFALIQFALERLIKKGFTPFLTPDMAKRDVLNGMGFNPRGESTQVYNVENTDLSLIGTAEITMGGYHMNETFTEEELPKKYAAVSHCFRTEAGSYSKFSKGIFRVHQFTKVEMFVYCRGEEAEKLHLEMLKIQKELLRELEIPFRVVDHCTADLGTPSARTYDLEAWMPGKPNKNGDNGDWAEVSSASNCTDYQSRALNIKYKTKQGEKELVHTLNGTAVVLSRIPIAIIENFQQKDGSIAIPEPLLKYMPEGVKTINRG